MDIISDRAAAETFDKMDEVLEKTPRALLAAGLLAAFGSAAAVSATAAVQMYPHPACVPAGLMAAWTGAIAIVPVAQGAYDAVKKVGNVMFNR